MNPPEKQAEITITFHLMPLSANMRARTVGVSSASSSGGSTRARLSTSIPETTVMFIPRKEPKADRYRG
jgi:hypothetical protein